MGRLLLLNEAHTTGYGAMFALAIVLAIELLRSPPQGSGGSAVVAG